MRPYLVVDCSYILSGILPDEPDNTIDLSAYRLHVPALFYLECTNVLISSLKRGRLQPVDFNEYVRILADLPFHVDPFCSTPESVFSITNLSQKFGLTTYDASYLELAIRLNAKLATHDKKLLQVANNHWPVLGILAV